MVLLNVNTLVLFAGLAALALNIIISLVEYQRCHFRANILNVALTLVGCGLVGYGLFRLSFPVFAESSALVGSVVGAIIALALGVGLWLGERRQDGFDPSYSPGLLSAGAGVFVLIAALVIPTLPTQLTARAAAASFLPTTVVRTARSAQALAMKNSSTPTATATATLTPTELPTLTPTPVDPPSDTPTSADVAAALGTEASTPITCMITAQLMLTIRPGPSINEQAIGRVMQGIPVPATGRSKDNLWWRVSYSDGISAPLDGWVYGQYVTSGASCATANLPMIEITSTPSRTPRPSRTPYPSRTPRPTITSTPGA